MEYFEGPMVTVVRIEGYSLLVMMLLVGFFVSILILSLKCYRNNGYRQSFIENKNPKLVDE